MIYSDEHESLKPGPLFFWSFVVAIIVATIANNFAKSIDPAVMDSDSVMYAAAVISTFASYAAAFILVLASIGYALGFKSFAKKSLVSACILSIGITLNFLV